MASHVARDAQLIGHISYAADTFNDVFGAALLFAAGYGAAQRHFALDYFDDDLGGVENGVVGHAIANFFTDTLVGALIPLRAAADMMRLALLVLTPVAAAFASGP